MGWFLITVVLPLVAPVLLIMPFWALPLPPANAALAKLISPVKDGQLCWGAIGFCVSALYEMAEPGKGGHPIDGAYAGYVQAGFVILLLAASLIAAGGSIFPTHLGAPTGIGWYRYYKALTASLGLTLLAGGAYTMVHFTINPP